MTDYPETKKSSKRPVWAKREVFLRKMETARRWRGFLAIFICVFLGFFIINGAMRAISLKKYVSDSRWDEAMPFAAAISTTPPSVLVFNKGIGEIVVLKVPDELNVPTGDATSPSIKVSDINTGKGGEMNKVLTRVLGLDIQNYAVLKDKKDIDQATLEEAYRNFSSFSTLAAVVTVGKIPGIKSTNITRIDLLRLWWQVKLSGIKSPKIIDLGQFLGSTLGPGGTQIEGLDSELLHQTINKYFEIKNLADQNIKLEVKNSSGAAGIGQLAGEIATSAGFNVTRVGTGEVKTAGCRIVAGSKNLRAVSYLANIFKCDIVAPPSDAQGAPIMLDLGSDFAKSLF
ncbi:MAG: LytR C-terminal domain-containing protein [Candidatus Curtissbacteria bacterium]|nr:LytR C-terminal domain-containing protein [Candidatus Curtissbacteria bacterium]